MRGGWIQDCSSPGSCPHPSEPLNLDRDDSTRPSEEFQSKPGDSLPNMADGGFLIRANGWTPSDNTPTTQIELAEEVWVCPRVHKRNSLKTTAEANEAPSCVASLEFLLIFFFWDMFIPSEVEMDL